MTKRTRGRRRGTRLALIFVGVLALAWCGYWYASSQIAASAAEKLIASLAAGGRDVTCSRNVTGGFPLSLDLDCGEATFNDRTAGVAVALSRVSATAPLYWPGSVSAELAAPMALDAPAQGASLDADWTRAVAHADAGLDGLTRVALEFDGLSLKPKGGKGGKAGKSALQFAEFGAGRAEVFAEPAAGDSYRFFVLADEVLVKPRKGDAYPRVATRIDVTAHDFGSSLGTDPGQALKAWLARGGLVDVDTFEISLGGSSVLAHGQVQLSPEGLLSGNLVVHLSGLGKLPKAVEKIRPGSGDQLSQVIGAATMFTKPVNGDNNVRELPLVIVDGVVKVGVISVAKIPPLKL